MSLLPIDTPEKAKRRKRKFFSGYHRGIENILKLLTSTYRNVLLVMLTLLTLSLFIYVVIRSGPLAPVQITVTTVQNKQLHPQLFGIGTVEARYSYRIGPVVAGRIKRVVVQVGDTVQAGQIVAEIDPVDLDTRITGQVAAVQKAEASLKTAEAQLREATARDRYAQLQATRYGELISGGAVSKETAENKLQDAQVTESSRAASQANLRAAAQELSRIRSDLKSLKEQRGNLVLRSPASGLVTLRDAEPGTTVVSGQTVIEIIDPATIWLNVRFNQAEVGTLKAGQSARISLRSRPDQPFRGTLTRIEPKADSVTEETLAKVSFDALPTPVPAVGEMVEVIITLPDLPAAPVVPNSAIHRYDNKTGVWLLNGGKLHFAPARFGGKDLDGLVQVVEGVTAGEQVVVYSRQALNQKTRVRVVKQLSGAPK